MRSDRIEAYPVSPNGAPGPCTDVEQSVGQEVPDGRLADGVEKPGVGKEGESIGNLQAQVGGLEAVRLRSVLHDAISNHVTGVDNVLLTRLEG